MQRKTRPTIDKNLITKPETPESTKESKDETKFCSEKQCFIKL